jgi:hypothetical protein
LGLSDPAYTCVGACLMAKPSRGKGMNSIRLKITIHLNRNHALSDRDLNALKPLVERGIAASLPDAMAVDTISVTKVKEIRLRESDLTCTAPVDPAGKKTPKTARAVA